MPVIRLAQQAVPRLVLEAVDASGVGRRHQVRRRETARDQLVEELVGVPAVGDTRKRPGPAGLPRRLVAP